MKHEILTLQDVKLIDKYLPSDYSDSVTKRIKLAQPLTPDHIFEEMFCNFPKPVAWLFKLRDIIVKPFGLQEAAVTTVVKFNNFLGRIYFIGIWIFHKLLVKSLFRKAIKE